MKVKHLILAYNKELLHFIVKENKEIFYSDRKWKAWVKILPREENLILKINQSRNRVPGMIAQLFNFTENEVKEYEAAKDMDELCNIIIQDAKSKGVVLMKKEEVLEDGS